MTDIPTVDVPQNGSYAMVAQACAKAIQDAIAHQRNTETISTAVIGVAQETMLRAPLDQERVIATAQAAIAAALQNVEAVSTAVSKILRDFPRD